MFGCCFGLCGLFLFLFIVYGSLCYCVVVFLSLVFMILRGFGVLQFGGCVV